MSGHLELSKSKEIKVLWTNDEMKNLQLLDSE